jgi:hypothetical protein
VNTIRTTRLAYRLIRIAALEDRINLLSRKYSDVPVAVIRTLARIDPTGGKYLEWLVRQRINLGYINPSHITRVLGVYDKIKKSRTLLDHFDIDPDIGKYNIISLSLKLNPIINGATSLESRSEMIKKAKKAGAQVIYDKNNIKIIQIGGEGVNPKSANMAACMYAKNTKWCTSDPGMAEDHLKVSPLYVFFRGGQKVMQGDTHYLMFHDILDRGIEFKENKDLAEAILDARIFPPDSGFLKYLREAIRGV